MNFLDFILKRPVTMSMVALTALVLALFFGLRLPIELAPDIDLPRISISTFWSGASPEMMVSEVTSKIEAAAGEVKGIKKINSVTREGRSSITIQFERGINPDFAKLELSERLEVLWQQFPPGVSRPVFQKTVPKEFQDLQGFLTYQFYPKITAGTTLRLSPAEIKKRLDKILLPKLAAEQGIGDLTLTGATDEIIKVEVNPVSLAQYGLTLSDVQTALTEAGVSRSLGDVFSGSPQLSQIPQTTMTVAVRETFTALESVGKIVVAFRGKSFSAKDTSSVSAPIYLNDVAIISKTMPDVQEYFRVNGNEAISLDITREPTSNAISLAGKIDKIISETLSESLPTLDFTKEKDSSAEIKRELENLGKDALISVAAVIVVLLLFLRSLKISLVVLINIAFSLAIALLLLSALGYSLNILTVSGLVLVFGILTDNAIVVIDTIFKKSGLGLSKLDYIRAASQEIFLPVLASTLTTIGALIPILFLPEELRLYFQGFVISVSLSVFASLIIAFTLIPSLLYRFNFSGERQSGRLSVKWVGSIGQLLEKTYRKALGYILDHPKRFVLLVIWLLGIPIWALPEKFGAENSPNAANPAPVAADTNKTVPFWETAYNNTFGSSLFLSAKPYLNYALGGTGYLFYRYVSRSEYFGSPKETTIEISISMPQGTDPQKLSEVARLFEQPLTKYLLAATDSTTENKNIKKFLTQLSGNNGGVSIYFTENSDPRLPYLVYSDMTMIAARVGGASIAVYGYGPGFFSGGNEISSYRVKALGYNFDKLKFYCSELKTELEKNPRIDNCKIDKSRGFYSSGTELALKLNKENVARNALTPQQVFETVSKHSKGSQGQTQLTINSNEERVEVKFLGENEASVESAKNLVIPNESGGFTRLNDLAVIAKQSTMSEILRENQQYQRWVTFDYKGRYDFGQRFLENTVSRFPLAPGYTISTKSEFFFSFEDKTLGSLLWVALFSVLIIFMISAALYESFVKPLIILSAIPMSLIGVFFSFYFFDANFGRGGYASLILLAGIVVNNSIVLVDLVLLKTKQLKPASAVQLKQIILDACFSRTRPIIMTTLLTIASLIPLWVRSEQTSLWYGLTIGTIGGLLSSAILVLFILPAIYMLIERRRLNDDDSANKNQSIEPE
jgi:multidrug efflux pump subunit AcrB